MYKIFKASGRLVAVKLLASGRTAEDEFKEIKDILKLGYAVSIVEDYTEVGAKLIGRDYLFEI